MIKFFREIRQKLLTENRFNKYLLYAFGEIILVVIGILIALQINNWNESNNRREKLNNYLIALKDELNGNIDRLERAERWSKRDLEHSVYLIRTFNSDTATSYTSKDIASIEKGTGPFFKVELFSSVYKDLINAGVLENLKEPNMKRHIFEIERLLENYDEAFLNAKRIWDDYLLPYYHEHKNVTGVWDSIVHVPLPKLVFKNDVKAFVNNRDYSNLLASRSRQVANLMNTCRATIKIFEELVKEIESFLEDD